MTSHSRDKVIEIRKDNPDMTLLEIGIETGVSKQRVSQILISENLETRSTHRIPLPMPACKRCGVPVPYRRRLYCSSTCQRPAGKTVIVCHFCGKEVSLMTSMYKIRVTRSKYMHCSRACRDNSRRGQPRNYNE